MDSSIKTVAIIGAGPSGLVAAKHMLAVGILPTVFDRYPEIGGMWNPDCHPSWRSLRTNVSCFTTCYSDFPWPSESSIFPTQAEMCDYLKRYSAKFIPGQCFQLQSIVTRIEQVVQVEKDTASHWTVEWTNETGVQTKLFDRVVIATGFFSTRHIPPLPLENFKGTLLHSDEYRSPEVYRHKRVVVIGSSFSSAEISAEVCKYAKEVINIVSTPFWAIPRYIPLNNEDPATPFLPVDLVLYTCAGRESFQEAVIKTVEEYKISNMYMSAICGGTRHDFQPPQNSPSPSFVAISDDFLPCVRSGKIKIQPGRINAATGSSVILEDGTEIQEVDAIIFCTGFRPSFPFLPPTILEAISFDPNDSFCPLLLHKATFCPSFPGLAFVGVYRGPYFLVAELQAAWAAKVFSASNEPPISNIELLEGVLVEKRIREQIPRPQFPHPDYIGFACSLAGKVGILPSDEVMRTRSAFLPCDFSTVAGADNEALMARLSLERGKYMLGKMVAGAVFRALDGSWDVCQIQETSVDQEQVMKLKVHFEGEPKTVGVDHLEYLSSKWFENENSDRYNNLAFEEWTWRYDRRHDLLGVKIGGMTQPQFTTLHFLNPSCMEELDKEFHDMEAGWKAVAEYLMEDEIWKLHFTFHFTGILLKCVQVRISNRKTYSSLITFAPTN